jgi:hypothetical protein
VYLALTEELERRLLADLGDQGVREVADEIEETWAEEWLQETDKSWEALHRCLSDGTTDLIAGAYPLSHAVLGGRQLYFGGDFYVCYRTGAQVGDVARVLEPIDEAWLRQRYDLIDPADYQGVLGDEDFEYKWSWFGPIRDFHQRAAHAGTAIVFTVDQ